MYNTETTSNINLSRKFEQTKSSLILIFKSCRKMNRRPSLAESLSMTEMFSLSIILCPSRKHGEAVHLGEFLYEYFHNKSTKVILLYKIPFFSYKRLSKMKPYQLYYSKASDPHRNKCSTNFLKFFSSRTIML